MWNPAGRNPTWHLRHTFNKKHWERNFTLQGWVNFISPHKALLTLQPFRAVKIREQADARLVCKCNMTITCSEHFEMQHSSPQQQKVKTGFIFCCFLSFLIHPGISASCLILCWHRNCANLVLHLLHLQWSHLQVKPSGLNCLPGNCQKLWWAFVRMGKEEGSRVSECKSTRKWIKTLNHSATSTQQRLMAGDFAEAEIQMDLRPGKHNCSITDRAAASSAALFIYLIGLNTENARLYRCPLLPSHFLLLPSVMFVHRNECCHSYKQQCYSCIH